MADVVVENEISEVNVELGAQPPSISIGVGSGIVHGDDITAASLITPGTGNDFDVIGNGTVNYISTVGYGIGARLFFALKGTPTFANDMPAIPGGFGSMRIASTPSNFKPLTADSASVEFRFNGSTWDLIRIANY